jgi:hypothetical protein
MIFAPLKKPSHFHPSSIHHLLEDASHGHADPDRREGAEEEVPGTQKAGAQDAREETSDMRKSMGKIHGENPWQ